MKLAATLALVAAFQFSATATSAAPAELQDNGGNGGDEGLVLVLLVGALILIGGALQPATVAAGE